MIISSTLLSPVKAFLPDWPEWAVDVLLIMTGLLLATSLFTFFFKSDEDGESSSTDNASTTTAKTSNGEQQKEKQQKEKKEQRKQFDGFRRQYMLVYMIIMLADWMQGTHMYTLYLSYNVNISALFLTGFLSGAIFAPFLGSMVDMFGRKRSCIAYCVLEIIINTMEHSTNFTILLIGRVLGGISTNLLFSAFESWMTTEHRKRGFPDEWLSHTFSETSVGNGVMAILAGIVAQVLEDYLGHIGPFQGAIALTVLALVLILNWEENYGEEEGEDHSKSSLKKQFLQGWKSTVSDSRIWRIGMIQGLSEGAMYTFVFMWVPTLLSMDPPGGLPTGCVFSALMMAIAMGGIMFPPFQALVSRFVQKKNSTELCAALVYLLSAASILVPSMCLSIPIGSNEFGLCFEYIIASFMLVEFCVGMFMPLAGTLRSKYVPDALQGGILNIFRLPLNAIVVGGTYATEVLEPSVVYKLASGCYLLAAILQCSMMFPSSTATTERKKKD